MTETAQDLQAYPIADSTRKIYEGHLERLARMGFG